MGFNLKMFFEELEEVFESDDDYITMVAKLYTIVQENKKYAKECGQLK